MDPETPKVDLSQSSATGHRVGVHQRWSMSTPRIQSRVLILILFFPFQHKDSIGPTHSAAVLTLWHRRIETLKEPHEFLKLGPVKI
jgi:hypothetical protein